MSVTISYSNDGEGAVVVRAAVAAIMARAEASIEKIEDAKLAVSEATTIVSDEVDGVELSARIEHVKDGIRITVVGESALGGSDLAWTVLEAVSAHIIEGSNSLTFEIGYA